MAEVAAARGRSVTCDSDCLPRPEIEIMPTESDGPGLESIILFMELAL